MKVSPLKKKIIPEEKVPPAVSQSSVSFTPPPQGKYELINLIILKSNKLRNKEVKIRNGNIMKSVKVIHWNLGSKYWDNKKEEIQCIVDEMKPDIIYISEANIFSGLLPELRIIEGYNLVVSRFMDTTGYSRLALLIRDGFQAEVKEDWMQEDVASIWIQVKRRGYKTLTLGGIYREQKLLLQGYPNNSDEDNLQNLRWDKFISQWTYAANNNLCFVVGDMNLDFFKMEHTRT